MVNYWSIYIRRSGYPYWSIYRRRSGYPYWSIYRRRSGYPYWSIYRRWSGYPYWSIYRRRSGYLPFSELAFAYTCIYNSIKEQWIPDNPICQSVVVMVFIFWFAHLTLFTQISPKMVFTFFLIIINDIIAAGPTKMAILIISFK